MIFYELINMIIINFVFPEHEILPEVNHYIAYFTMHNIVCFKNAAFLKEISENEVTYIEWHIMGTHFYNKPRFLNQISGKSYLVHEYASLSTGRYKFIKLLKDIIKRHCSRRPDYQLFLNEYIQSKMAIRGISGELRDMGVSQFFMQNNNNAFSESAEVYDYAYVGSMAAERKIEDFIDANIMRQKKILLIGTPVEYLVKRYKGNNNIKFVGKIDQNEIPEYLSKIKVCVNYVPDVYPYNRQTSTKLIEYLTLGKDVISNKYKWVMDFVRDNSLEFETLDDEFIYIRNNGNYHAQEWCSIIGSLDITRKIKKNEPF